MSRSPRSRARITAALAAALILTSACMQQPDTPAPGGDNGGSNVWDAGNIISDAVFYNSSAMTPAQIQTFLDDKGSSCTDSLCLRAVTMNVAPKSVAWCSPYNGNLNASYAQMLYDMSKACGINPQVVLVLIQKESQGLTRSPVPAALTGFGCPDDGPGGSASCNGDSGAIAQTWGAVQAFAHLKADHSRINYPPGQTSDILWNVAETGCGSAPVFVQNLATATLYTYTPYQPNAASLAAYPGTGDSCSSYGNRNFFYMFNEYFGTTGGGRPPAPGAPGGGGPTPPGMEQNPSNDPSSFGWVHAGPMEPLVFQGHNFGSVAQGTANLWKAMLSELVPQIPGGLNSDLGCFEDRNNVNNPGVLSFHAFGIACDLNSGVNCNGCSAASIQGQQYALPMNTGEIVAKYGFGWGGHFTGTPDPMHIEAHITPGQVANWNASHGGV